MATIKFRRGPAALWAEKNPVLASGEPGYETDTGVYKIGDGVTPWSALAGLGSQTRSATTTYVSYFGTAPSGTPDESDGWTVTRINLADLVVTTGHGAWSDREFLDYD